MYKISAAVSMYLVRSHISRENLYFKYQGLRCSRKRRSLKPSHDHFQIVLGKVFGIGFTSNKASGGIARRHFNHGFYEVRHNGGSSDGLGLGQTGLCAHPVLPKKKIKWPETNLHKPPQDRLHADFRFQTLFWPRRLV